MSKTITISYNYEGDRLEFVYSSDGTGHFTDQSYDDTVKFKWDADKIPFTEEALEEITPTILEEYNGDLSDPFLMGSELEDTPIDFISGSQEQLEQQTALVIRAFSHFYPDVTEVNIPYLSESHENPGLNEDELDYDNDKRFTTFLKRPAGKVFLDIIRKIYSDNAFSGETHEYNDGASNRQSGYSTYGVQLSKYYSLESVSMHERVMARVELRNHLLSDPDLLKRVIPFMESEGVRAPNPDI